MLVDFRDRMKLDGEPKPIMVDLSDEKKPPWMFTLDGLILFRTLDGGLDMDGGFTLDGLNSILNAGQRPHSILNAGRRPHS